MRRFDSDPRLQNLSSPNPRKCAANLGNNLLDSTTQSEDDGADGNDPWFSVLVRRSGSPEDEDAKIHAMIFSYFDDSADEKRESYIASGGIIAHHGRWNGFESRWRDETRELTEPFRAAECESQHGQFKTWPKPKCDELMARLVTVILEFKFGGFASIVPVQEFKSMFSLADNSKAADAAYRLAVAHTIMNIAHVGEVHSEIAKFWFESSSESKPNKSKTNAATLALYDNLQSLKCWENKDLLGGISFDNKTLRPLQAADLVAREAFKHVYNLGKRPTRKPVERLWDSIGFVLWTRGELELLRDRGWPDNLGALVCWGSAKNPFYVTLKEG